jgi:hypothetical protein
MKNLLNKLVAMALIATMAVMVGCDVNTEITDIGGVTGEQRGNEQPVGIYVEKEGDIVQLGGYDWRVLDIQRKGSVDSPRSQWFSRIDNCEDLVDYIPFPHDMALIISDRIIAGGLYHDTDESVTWETSDMREYLNNEFYNKFNSLEREKIIKTFNISPRDTWYDTDAGGHTEDYIFLLSTTEATRYGFGQTAIVKDYEKEDVILSNGNSNRVALDVNTGESRYWWLRTPGWSTRSVAVVGLYGHIMLDGISAHKANLGIRPAMWIKVDNIVTTQPPQTTARITSATTEATQPSTSNNEFDGVWLPMATYTNCVKIRINGSEGEIFTGATMFGDSVYWNLTIDHERQSIRAWERGSAMFGNTVFYRWDFAMTSDGMLRLSGGQRLSTSFGQNFDPVMSFIKG